MRKEYDFSNAKRASEVPHLAKLQSEMKGKTRVTMWVDNDVLAAFRARAAQQGKGYQTLMNDALRTHSHDEAVPVTVEALRRMLRETIHEELRENNACPPQPAVERSILESR